MKRVLFLALVAALALAAHARTALAQAAPESEPQRATLFALNKHQNHGRTESFSFRTGTLAQGGDLYYGTLYVNEDHDWFQVGLGREARTAFRDLGAHDWTDSLSVPFVEPFPKLKGGEQRSVSVDASGADGEDGADGADGADWDGVVRPKPHPPKPVSPRRPKHDGVPKVDPVFVKAVPGHMYVIRVVDGTVDFYVLFRVESLVRGDNCTITWKRVPPPRAESAGQS